MTKNNPAPLEETKGPEAKAPETKGPEAPEAKAAEAKAPEPKAPEPKAPEPKAHKTRVHKPAEEKEPLPEPTKEKIEAQILSKLSSRSVEGESNPFVPNSQLENEVKNVAQEEGFILSRGTEVGARLIARSRRDNA